MNHESLGSIISKLNWYLSTYFQSQINKRNLNITQEQFVILMTVYNNPGIIQKDIGKYTLKDKTNVARILNLLVKKKFLKKKKSKKDNRAYYIYITDLGKKIVKRLIPIVEEVDKNIVKNFSKSEISYFRKYLFDLRKTIKDLLNQDI